MIDDRVEVRADGVSTLRHYLVVLWRRKWLVLVPLVLIPLVVFVATARQPDVYEASADVLVDRQETVTTSVIGQTPAFDDIGRTIDTHATLARLPSFAERVVAEAGLEGRSGLGLLGSSVVYPLSNVLRFTVSDRDPGVAARLATAYARTFVAYRRELDTVELSRTLAQLRSQITRLENAGRTASPLYVRLADRENQLEVLKTLRSSNISLVHSARAADAEQVAPRPLRNLALALAAGLVFGLVAAALWETLSTKPRSRGEMEALLGMPCLGHLTLERAAPDEPLQLLRTPAGPGADAFHALRAGLELARGTEGGAIMVTSRHADEGKTETAANIAVALARVGRHVVLVDLDLRDGELSTLLGLEGRAGATTLARGDAELAGALHTVAIEPGTPVHGEVDGLGDAAGRLEVLPSGPPTDRPAELLSSRRLAAALAELEQRADVVLVDVPPLLTAPDGAAATELGRSLLHVVDADAARTPELAEVRRLLDPWPITKLGFVVTETPRAGASVRPRRRRATAGGGRVAGPEGVA